MEEFGIKCMEKMFKRLEKKREEVGENQTTAVTRSKTAPRRVNLERETLGQSVEKKKHIANMHIDMVPDIMKSKRVSSAIKLCTDKVFESRAVTPWRYTGFKDTIESPVNKEYLQRPDKPNKRKKANSDDEKDEENSEDKKGGNRDKTKLYKKSIKEIKQFPFMANKYNKDEIEEEEDEYEKSRSRPKKAGRMDDDFGKPAKGANDSGGGGAFGLDW